MRRYVKGELVHAEGCPRGTLYRICSGSPTWWRNVFRPTSSWIGEVDPIAWEERKEWREDLARLFAYVWTEGQPLTKPLFDLPEHGGLTLPHWWSRLVNEKQLAAYFAAAKRSA